jgi:hypothetical protein
MSDPADQSHDAPLHEMASVPGNAGVASGAAPLSDDDDTSPAAPAKPTESEGAGPREWKRLLQTGAFLAGAIPGVLGTVWVHQVLNSTIYMTVAGLVTLIIAAIITGIIARSEISLLAIGLALGGGAVGIAIPALFYLLHTTSPGPVSAIPHILPVGHTNEDVGAYGNADFSVNVPSGYTTLTVSFAVTSTGSSGDNCINGSQQDIAIAFEATSPPSPPPERFGAPLNVSIPPGVSSFTIGVKFIPQPNYQFCDENVQVAAGQFSH